MSHRRLVVIMAGSALAVVAVAGGLGWREWTRTPEYSLGRIARAIEHRDRYELEKYVDLDALLQAAMTDLTDGNVLATALGPTMVTALKPQLVKLVEDGTPPADGRFARGVEALRDPTWKPVIERHERNAYVSVPTVTQGGAPFVLKVHLTQVADGWWRADRVGNLKELRAAEAEEERLHKLAVARANDAKLAELVVVARVKTAKRVGPYGFERKNVFQVRFENKSGKRIRSITGDIEVPGCEFKAGARANLDLDPSREEAYAWSFDVNRFVEPTECVWRMGETENFEVRVVSLTYADDTHVRRGSDE